MKDKNKQTTSASGVFVFVVVVSEGIFSLVVKVVDLPSREELLRAQKTRHEEVEKIPKFGHIILNGRA